MLSCEPIRLNWSDLTEVIISFQYVVFIVVGTGLLFMLIFHVGLKEPQRSCTSVLAKEGSKRSASNWIHWFKEIQFYQVCRWNDVHWFLAIFRKSCWLNLLFHKGWVDFDPPPHPLPGFLRPLLPSPAQNSKAKDPLLPGFSLILWRSYMLMQLICQ